VVSNRGAAHSFPPELRDLYEPWVEFSVSADDGREVFHSGLVKPDGTLDESAHVYKQVLVDAQGRAITRHQVWVAAIKAYDNAIPPGRSDIVRYRFRVPDLGGTTGPIRLKLEARLNYRRFTREYTDFVLKPRGSTLMIPVIEMAGSETEIGRGVGRAARLPGSRLKQTHSAEFRMTQSESSFQVRPGLLDSVARRKESVRWYDYGIGMFEQAQYGPASDAFRRAAALDPDNPAPLVSAALSELKTERYGTERDQLEKASKLLDEALTLDPDNPRGRLYKAIVLRSQRQVQSAVEILVCLAREYPRDREVQRQLGQTLYSVGEVDQARIAFEAVIAIDPRDAVAYRFLAAIYAALGRRADSSRANGLYLQWRDDPMAASVADRFYNAHPEWSDERVQSHTHGEGAARRPVLTGPAASPY
jgi:predicted Zn-dependent protease